MLPLVIAGGALLLHMGSKLMGSDPDFTQAYMFNAMSGRGGFLQTYFGDGLKSLFLGGSRTMAAAFSSGNPMAAMLYSNPHMMGMNPYMANPYMMGRMPYMPMNLGMRMWL